MKLYEYGAQAPRVNADLVAEQMRRAHRYYNMLVELEQRRRAEYDGHIEGGYNGYRCGEPARERADGVWMCDACDARRGS